MDTERVIAELGAMDMEAQEKAIKKYRRATEAAFEKLHQAEQEVLRTSPKVARARKQYDREIQAAIKEYKATSPLPEELR
jgi:hypothetical protein